MSRSLSGSLPATALLAIAILSSADTASAQWSGTPGLNLPVCTRPGPQTGPFLIVGPQGSGTLVWQDARAGNDDIYAQWLDERGFARWGDGGAGICTELHPQVAPCAVASAAGTIVLWQDGRGDVGDIYAQLAGAGGAGQWAADGVAVCARAGSQLLPVATTDGAGGAIVAWMDDRDGPDPHLYAQRIGPDGATLWPGEGVRLSSSDSAQTAAVILSDGAGGAILAWIHGRIGLRAQRVNGAGTLLYPPEGVSLCDRGAPRAVAAVADGAAGMVATWENVDGTNFFRDIYAQRLDATGAKLWPDTGVVVCAARYLQRVPVLAPDGSGGAIVAWEDGRSFHLAEVFAQRVDGGGVLRWATDGVALCSVSPSRPFPSIVADGSGGALVAWRDGRNGSLDLYAQRVNDTGAAQWPAQGIPVSTAPDSQTAQVMGADGAGGFVLAWVDGRNPLTRPDLYAQRVRADGSLDTTLVSAVIGRGDPEALRLEAASPNPAGSATRIRFVLPHAGRASLTVYDERGRLVRELAGGVLGAGGHAVDWNLLDHSGREVPSGIYFYRLASRERTLTGRLSVMR